MNAKDFILRLRAKAGEHWPALAVVAAATVARVIYILSLRDNPMFVPLLPGYDMTVFHEWAKRIASGVLSDSKAFYQAPLYPYLLGALYAVTGTSVLAAKLAQACLGGLSVGLVYFLGQRLFGRSAGLTAAVLTAAAPIFPFYEGFLLRETLAVFLNLALLAALASLDPARPLRGALLSGALLGLAALCRSNTLAFLPAAAYWVWRVFQDTPRRATAPAAFLAAALAVISPATLHNRIAGGQWALIETSAGVNWKIGNSYDSTGGFWPVTRPTVPVLSTDFLRLQGVKLRKLLSDYEEPNNLNFYHFRRYNAWLRLPVLSWGFFLAFGLAGIVLSWPTRRQLFPLYWYLVLYGLGLVAFFITSRFRLPLWPVLILFSGYAFSRAAQWIRQGRILAPALALALPALLALILVRGAPKIIQPQYFDNMALVCEKRGDFAGAIREMQDRLALYPGDPGARLGLALYLHQAGRAQEALDLTRGLIETHPGLPQVWRNAGLLELELGRPDRAAGYFRHYLELYPQDPDSARLRRLACGSGEH